MDKKFNLLKLAFSFLSVEPIVKDGLMHYFGGIVANADNLKKEIELANESPSFSWSKFAEKHDFVFFDAKKTEEEIYLSFYFFIKYLIYPEKRIPANKKYILEKWLVNNLSHKEWIDMHTLVKKVNSSISELENLDEIDLFHTLVSNVDGRFVFEMRHQLGTNDYYFKLFREKEKFFQISIRKYPFHRVKFPSYPNELKGGFAGSTS